MTAKPLRRCRFCRLILDDHAPAAGAVDGKGDRKVRAHCTAAACNWCIACMTRRLAAFQAGRTP